MGGLNLFFVSHGRQPGAGRTNVQVNKIQDVRTLLILLSSRLEASVLLLSADGGKFGSGECENGKGLRRDSGRVSLSACVLA